MATHELTQLNMDQEWIKIIESMVNKLADTVGVTVNGNRISLRWNQRAKLVGVDLLILSVDDGVEETESIEDEIEPTLEMTSDAPREPEPDE